MSCKLVGFSSFVGGVKVGLALPLGPELAGSDCITRGSYTRDCITCVSYTRDCITRAATCQLRLIHGENHRAGQCHDKTKI